MDGLPSNIIFNIFSRVPAKCLARSRCVSKLWCNYIDDRYLLIVHDQCVKEEPTPILCHSHLTYDGSPRSLCFHVVESKQPETQTQTTDCTCILKLRQQEYPFLEFLRKKLLSEISHVQIEIRGSCNGLMCLSQDEDFLVTSLFVVDPLRKECYEVPPLPMHFDSSVFRDSCGLGFDASTNTLKMVCVLLKDPAVPSKDHDMVRKNLCTMVHVFGTNSWREISHVPFYPIEGKSVFANGCLYWLASSLDITTEYGGPVIWFDVEKEEFGLIDPPNGKCDLFRIMGCGYDYLVDLNGEVGFVFLRTMEVWVLNKQKEWVLHCQIEKRLEPGCYTQILGCWNTDGDMLIRDSGNGDHEFFIYNLKSGTLHKTNMFGSDDVFTPYIFMRPNKLSSIRGIGTNSFVMKITDLKESCQRLLSAYDYNSDSLCNKCFYSSFQSRFLLQ